MKTKPQSMKEQTITTGTTVTWTSQSQGSATTKTGIVVAVVPPNEHPLPYAPVEAKIDASGMPRPKESYLVKAEGRKALYWPHASRLKVVKQSKPSAVAGGKGCEVSKEIRACSPEDHEIEQLKEINRELLEALKELESIQTGPPPDRYYREDWRQVMRKVSSAIAKAEGGQP